MGSEKRSGSTLPENAVTRAEKHVQGSTRRRRWRRPTDCRGTCLCGSVGSRETWFTLGIAHPVAVLILLLHRPSGTVNLPALIHLRKAGPLVYRAGLNLGRLATRHWSNPVRRLRRDEGLRCDCDPVFRDKFSPHLVLALFSPASLRSSGIGPGRRRNQALFISRHRKSRKCYQS